MPIIMGLLIATGFCILAGYGLYQFTVNGSNYSTYVFFRLFCIPYVKIFPLLVVLIAPFAFFYFVRLDDLYDKTPMMIATYIWIGTFILIGFSICSRKKYKAIVDFLKAVKESLPNETLKFNNWASISESRQLKHIIKLVLTHFKKKNIDSISVVSKILRNYRQTNCTDFRSNQTVIKLAKQNLTEDDAFWQLYRDYDVDINSIDSFKEFVSNYHYDKNDRDYQIWLNEQDQALLSYLETNNYEAIYNFVDENDNMFIEKIRRFNYKYMPDIRYKKNVEATKWLEDYKLERYCRKWNISKEFVEYLDNGDYEKALKLVDFRERILTEYLYLFRKYEIEEQEKLERWLNKRRVKIQVKKFGTSIEEIIPLLKKKQVKTVFKMLNKEHALVRFIIDVYFEDESSLRWELKELLPKKHTGNRSRKSNLPTYCRHCGGIIDWLSNDFGKCRMCNTTWERMSKAQTQMMKQPYVPDQYTREELRLEMRERGIRSAGEPPWIK